MLRYNSTGVRHYFWAKLCVPSRLQRTDVGGNIYINHSVTELIKEVGIVAATAWIGNSAGVALKHYGQVTDSEMKEAAKKQIIETAKGGLQKSLHKSAVSSCKETQEGKAEGDINPCDCKTLRQKNRALHLPAKPYKAPRVGLDLSFGQSSTYNLAVNPPASDSLYRSWNQAILFRFRFLATLLVS
ncbi:hypothetical protein [Sedimentisphaera salicampi]|uniref:hypothetical protein n=1 Tax=Sedimentisphaera salicampi TaxID=1941349 RepID=UPI000B9D032D|nr:hypothetical protein [Sedimentisphaera salicampi]OXU14363.1 hypothetical protein SMSP1_01905 [Sedimentisphaera salicampi]